MEAKKYKLITFVPEAQADTVRKAMGDAGAGIIGNYSHCSFSSKGTGRFLPEYGANPVIGKVGTLEEVVEERIEVTCEQNKLQGIIQAMKAVHPYEEVAYDVYRLENV